MPFIVATYVYASSQGQRTHSARTNYRMAILAIVIVWDTGIVQLWLQGIHTGEDFLVRVRNRSNLDEIANAINRTVMKINNVTHNRLMNEKQIY